MRSGFANDRTDRARLTGGARAELEHDLGAYEPGLLEQRFVTDVEAVPVNTNACRKTGTRESVLDDRPSRIPDPFGQAGADCSRPPPFLAARWGKGGIAGARYQVWREGADVIGDVDIFEETPDRAPHLRQRSAALEGQVLGERAVEQNAERRDDPDLLLQQVRLVVAAALHHLQGIASVVD